MKKREIHKKIGIADKNLNYYEINDDNIKTIYKNNNEFDGIKIKINTYNKKILILLFKKINIFINNNKIDINKHLFYVDNYKDKDIYYLNELVTMIEVNSINSLKKRYSYIYDYVCGELDYRFNTYNICDFKNDICCRKKCLIHKFNIDILKYGCCYTKGRVCKYLKNKHCTIKSISCKFFTCNHLKKKGYCYKPSDFAIINYFFNRKQKRVIRDSLFTDKNKMIDLLISSRNKFKD